MLSSIKKTTAGCVLSLTLLLGGCAPNMIQASMDVWCDTSVPETPTHAQYATYSHQQKINMATHNQFGAKHCGWRPVR